jgi:hypothetical protein
MYENRLLSDLPSVNMAYFVTSAQPNLKPATQFLSTDTTQNMLMALNLPQTPLGLEMDTSLREVAGSNWIF